jgi:hypothetical protein
MTPAEIAMFFFPFIVTWFLITLTTLAEGKSKQKPRHKQNHVDNGIKNTNFTNLNSQQWNVSNFFRQTHQQQY